MMLGKGDGVFSSEFLVGSDLIGKSFFGSLHSCLLSFPNFLVGGLFGICFAWIFFDLGKGCFLLGEGDGMLGSEFLIGSDLISKSFFGSLQSSLLSFPNFLVSGLFGIGFTWITFSFRFKLGERWSSWSSGCGSVLLSIIFSFLFFLTWSISFSGFFLLFGWLSSSQLSVSTIRVTEWLWNNLGNPVLMPRVGSNTFSVS